MINPPRHPRLRVLSAFSLAVLLALALAPHPVQAQSAPAPAPTPAPTTVADSPESSNPVTLEAVTVTGVRASLASGQELKEDSLNLIDSVVAQDIGKFPDNTVVDAPNMP